MKYGYLTGAIVLGLLWLCSYIKIPFPRIPEYESYTIAEEYKIFDLRRHLRSYDALRGSITTRQSQLRDFYEVADTNTRRELLYDTQQYLFRTITQAIIPYWYETEWDFNGTTENPRDGQIACGYFVTTVLKHAGIDLDRIAMSQAPSGILIQKVCDKASIITIHDNRYEDFLEHLDRAPDGLYIVGLDTHVGFIEKKGDVLVFIHSRKPRSAGVIREPVNQARTLKRSKIYVLGNLLSNESLLRKWLSHPPATLFSMSKPDA